MEEIHKLRVSVARIAQQLGYDIAAEIPGALTHSNPMPFEQLCEVARTHDRGWNRLAALILDEIERLQQKGYRYDAQQDY